MPFCWFCHEAAHLTWKELFTWSPRELALVPFLNVSIEVAEEKRNVFEELFYFD